MAIFGSGKQVTLKPCASNPGMGAELSIGFARAGRTWTEHADVVSEAASVLAAQGYEVQREKDWLVHPASGYLLLPQIVSFEPLDDGGVKTTTTMQANHPVLAPDGIFEYQHSTGESTADSVHKGFDQWIQTDFVPLLDALEPKPKTCTSLETPFPAHAAGPARARRAVLGPPMHFKEEPPATVEGEEHQFCPCCLLTNSFETFRELFEGDGFYGVRLLAIRDREGNAQADCRVNGDDWEKGAEALRNYANAWPQAGFEFRKQYVVLQSIEKE